MWNAVRFNGSAKARLISESPLLASILHVFLALVSLCVVSIEVKAVLCIRDDLSAVSPFFCRCQHRNVIDKSLGSND